MAWLKEQKWVDTQRIAMTGISFGGIQTLLTAEKGLGIRAFVAFAPAAQSWNPVLADRLKRAVRQARSPIFHCPGAKRLQSGAKQGAGKETGEEGRSQSNQVYPAFGTTEQDGHWVFASRRDGIAIWEADVEAFLSQTMA